MLLFQIIANLEALSPVYHKLLVFFGLSEVFRSLHLNDVTLCCLHLVSVYFDMFFVQLFSNHIVWEVALMKKSTFTFEEFGAFFIIDWLSESESCHYLISLLFLLFWLSPVKVHILSNCNNLFNVNFIIG